MYQETKGDRSTKKWQEKRETGTNFGTKRKENIETKFRIQSRN